MNKSAYLVIISGVFLLTFSLDAKEMYKWTDDDGTVHITDKKSGVPPHVLEDLEKLEWNNEDPLYYQNNNETDDRSFEFKPSENYVDDIVNTDHERELKQLWRERAKKIEDRQIEIDYRLRAAKNDHKYKKKELEYLLVEGYTVDTRITELRHLEKYIEELEQEKHEIAPLMDNLRIEARKAGIPEGYLRP